MKTAYFSTDNKIISSWLLKCFGIDTIKEYSAADIVIFPGGLDVDPNIYGEPSGQRTSYNRRIDEGWVDVYRRAMKDGKKIIGICKGAQFVTVMAGGSLYQHVNHHAIASTHTINVNGEILHVTSTHHQMMNPFMLEKEDYEVLAFSEERRSDVYLNGYDDELAVPVKELEAVFYRGNGVLAIQFHPEFIEDEDPIQDIIKGWIDKTLEYTPKVVHDKYTPKVDPNAKKRKFSKGNGAFDGKISKEVFDEFVANYLQ